jgi:hypothetical protein
MWRGVSYPALHWQVAVVKPGTFRLWKNLANPILYEPGSAVRSLPYGAPHGALVSVLLVMCLQGLLHDPLGLSLVVRYDPASYSPRAIAFPSPGGLAFSLTGPTILGHLGDSHNMYLSLQLCKPASCCPVLGW